MLQNVTGNCSVWTELQSLFGTYPSLSTTFRRSFLRHIGSQRSIILGSQTSNDAESSMAGRTPRLSIHRPSRSQLYPVLRHSRLEYRRPDAGLADRALDLRQMSVRKCPRDDQTDHFWDSGKRCFGSDFINSERG